ncbi:unnamed protein product [Nippostrongylus brasiliensis]|uniref:Uncharacterized protein n=1 Tax=Nippostrongylus brasiliensis TaxID=27835 RepID=A0A0N4XIR1_NIPBR|nr:unnamed protein product [Nippostrongylus brasiliensis]
MEDESRVHRREARIPDLTAYPLRLEARLEDMSTMAGWSGHRTVGVCITKTNSFLRLEVGACGAKSRGAPTPRHHEDVPLEQWFTLPRRATKDQKNHDWRLYSFCFGFSGTRVLITATTDVAIAQCTSTLLRLDTMPSSRYAVISPKRSLLTLHFLQRAQICMRSPPYGFVIRSNRSPSIVAAASELDGFA